LSMIIKNNTRSLTVWLVFVSDEFCVIVYVLAFVF
jgi:hypothetical protein